MIHWPINPIEDQIFIHGSRLWVYKDCTWISTCCPDSIRCDIKNGIIIGFTFTSGDEPLTYPITMLLPFTYDANTETWKFEAGTGIYTISYSDPSWSLDYTPNYGSPVLVGELMSIYVFHEPIGNWNSNYGIDFSISSRCGTVETEVDYTEILVPVVENGGGIYGTPSAFASVEGLIDLGVFSLESVVQYCTGPHKTIDVAFFVPSNLDISTAKAQYSLDDVVFIDIDPVLWDVSSGWNNKSVTIGNFVDTMSVYIRIYGSVTEQTNSLPITLISCESEHTPTITINSAELTTITADFALTYYYNIAPDSIGIEYSTDDIFWQTAGFNLVLPVQSEPITTSGTYVFDDSSNLESGKYYRLVGRDQFGALIYSNSYRFIYNIDVQYNDIITIIDL